MVMIIIHIDYITCLVHAYCVIVVYEIHQRAGRISYFAEPSIMRLAGTVRREVGALTI